jgi:hypothetical protein
MPTAVRDRAYLGLFAKFELTGLHKLLFFQASVLPDDVLPDGGSSAGGVVPEPRPLALAAPRPAPPPSLLSLPSPPQLFR